jgi:hypothetical protein
MSDSPVWEWFGLSRAAYAVLPRMIMCAMPKDWQDRFVALMNEIEETFDIPDQRIDFTILVQDMKGKFARDEFADYRHGDPEKYRRKGK